MGFAKYILSEKVYIKNLEQNNRFTRRII